MLKAGQATIEIAIQNGGSGLSWDHDKSRAVTAMPSVSDAVVTVR